MDLSIEPSRLSMTSRVLLGLLLLANLVLALYLYFAEPGAVREGELPAPYVPEQSLRLISELDPSDHFNYTALSVTYQRAYAGTQDMTYVTKAEDAMAKAHEIQAQARRPS